MWFINLRSLPGPCATVSHADGATVIRLDPKTGSKISVTGLGPFGHAFEGLAREVADKTVVLVTHGFNVGLKDGLNSLAALAQYLEIEFTKAGRDEFIIIGVLWPGDFNHIPVNYVWEHHDAVQAGVVLAELLQMHFGRARSLNFISHSLGARVVLSCLQNLSGFSVDQVCLTAPAVDADVFKKQYATVLAKARDLRVMASKTDKVLMLAYPPGDFVADVFVGDTDSPFVAALGRSGAKPAPAPVRNYQIRSTFLWLDKRADRNFDHGDYFPDVTLAEPVKPADFDPRPEQAVTTHLARVLMGNPPSWPPAA